jgi:hypothetical protein
LPVAHRSIPLLTDELCPPGFGLRQKALERLQHQRRRRQHEMRARRIDRGSLLTTDGRAARKELSIRWSVAGDQLVFNRPVPRNQIFRINADGSGETQLTNTPVGLNLFPAPGLARVHDSGEACDEGVNSTVTRLSGPAFLLYGPVGLALHRPGIPSRRDFREVRRVRP